MWITSLSVFGDGGKKQHLRLEFENYQLLSSRHVFLDIFAQYFSIGDSEVILGNTEARFKFGWGESRGVLSLVVGWGTEVGVILQCTSCGEFYAGGVYSPAEPREERRHKWSARS